jgi:hypothetical protein
MTAAEQLRLLLSIRLILSPFEEATLVANNMEHVLLLFAVALIHREIVLLIFFETRVVNGDAKFAFS